MTMEIGEIKRAMNIVNKQITGRLLSKNNMKVKLGLDAIQDMWAFMKMVTSSFAVRWKLRLTQNIRNGLFLSEIRINSAS